MAMAWLYGPIAAGAPAVETARRVMVASRADAGRGAGRCVVAMTVGSPSPGGVIVPSSTASRTTSAAAGGLVLEG